MFIGGVHTTLRNWTSEDIKLCDLTTSELRTILERQKRKRLLSCVHKRRKIQPIDRFPEDKYYGEKFVRWAIEAEKQVFGYTGVDAFGGVQRLNMRCLRRWSVARKKQNLALIYSFGEAIPEDHEIYFCTLTVQHPSKHTYTGQKKAIGDIRAAWKPFGVWLRHKIPEARYLRVMEPGEKNGYCHIHMVTSLPRRDEEKAMQIPQKWVEECLRNGNEADTKGQNIQKCEDIQNVGAYLSKYLAKSIETHDDYADSRNYWQWIEVCYRMHLRTVAMDAKSREYIKRKYMKLDVRGVPGEFTRVSVDLEENEEVGCYHSPLMAFLIRSGID